MIGIDGNNRHGLRATRLEGCPTHPRAPPLAYLINSSGLSYSPLTAIGTFLLILLAFLFTFLHPLLESIDN